LLWKTGGSAEPEAPAWTNLYLKMTIVHFVMVLTEDQHLTCHYKYILRRFWLK